MNVCAACDQMSYEGPRMLWTPGCFFFFFFLFLKIIQSVKKKCSYSSCVKPMCKGRSALFTPYHFRLWTLTPLVQAQVSQSASQSKPQAWQRLLLLPMSVTPGRLRRMDWCGVDVLCTFWIRKVYLTGVRFPLQNTWWLVRLFACVAGVCCWASDRATEFSIASVVCYTTWLPTPLEDCMFFDALSPNLLINVKKINASLCNDQYLFSVHEAFNKISNI